MEKALAVVSFGTTYPEARVSIERLEQALAREFPEHALCRAFTSGMVIRKIERQEGVRIETPEQLMERLVSEGCREVLCQSLHIINGEEYSKLHSVLAKYAGSFDRLRLGAPLLTKSEDYEACVKALLRRIPDAFSAPDAALVLMGHGTEHHSNAAYCQLENTFRYCGHENTYVGTVEGFPALDYVLARLKRKPQLRKVYLAPFMVVAGDHAQNDLAGPEPDSWRSIVERSGYETEVLLNGLGDFPEIEALFCAHAREASAVEAL